MSNGLPSALTVVAFATLMVGFAGNVAVTRGEVITYPPSERGTSQKSPTSVRSGGPSTTPFGNGGGAEVAEPCATATAGAGDASAGVGVDASFGAALPAT